MNRRVLVGVAGWLTVAAAATGVGIATIGVLEDGLTGDNVRPLDDAAVRRALRQSEPPPATSSPSPRPSPDGATKVLDARGGTVTITCSHGRATLESWVPAQGYRADDVAAGPAVAPRLTFKSDRTEYTVTAGCENGSPVVHTSEDDRHGGRGGSGRH